MSILPPLLCKSSAAFAEKLESEKSLTEAANMIKHFKVVVPVYSASTIKKMSGIFLCQLSLLVSAL